MSAPQLTADILMLPAILQFVTWLLVIFGWWYVNKTNDGREARKEYRSAIDGAKKEVAAIAKLGILYFTASKDELADEIKSALQMLEVELERLKDFRSSNLFIRLGEFQDACTAADFESGRRIQHAQSSAVIQGILFSRNRLIQQLELHFRELYPV